MWHHSGFETEVGREGAGHIPQRKGLSQRWRIPGANRSGLFEEMQGDDWRDGLITKHQKESRPRVGEMQSEEGSLSGCEGTERDDVGGSEQRIFGGTEIEMEVAADRGVNRRIDSESDAAGSRA